MLIAKILFLFLGVFFCLVNVIRVHYKQDIPFMNMFWQAVGMVGFLTLQFLV